MLELSKVNVLGTDNRSLNFKGSAASQSTEAKPAELSTKPVSVKALLDTQKGYALAFCGTKDPKGPTSVAERMPVALKSINESNPKTITVTADSDNPNIDSSVVNESERHNYIFMNDDFVGINNDYGSVASYRNVSKEHMQELGSNINNLPFVQRVKELGIDENHNPTKLLVTLAEKTLHSEGIEWKKDFYGYGTEYKNYNINIIKNKSYQEKYELKINDPETKNTLVIRIPNKEKEIVKLVDVIMEAITINKKNFDRLEQSIKDSQSKIK